VRCFEPCNRTLKFRKSLRTPKSRRTPKSPFWECECYLHTLPKWGCTIMLFISQNNDYLCVSCFILWCLMSLLWVIFNGLVVVIMFSLGWLFILYEVTNKLLWLFLLLLLSSFTWQVLWMKSYLWCKYSSFTNVQVFFSLHSIWSNRLSRPMGRLQTLHLSIHILHINVLFCVRLCFLLCFIWDGWSLIPMGSNYWYVQSLP
jgi:hypothetical protein